MEIDFLANHPQHLEQLAQWHHAMWGHLNPGTTVQDRLARLAGHPNRPTIPTTWIALRNGALLGSISLVENDLRTHPHLSPFIASVYVGEAFRRQGVASALVQQVMAAAQTMGIARLYLITPDQQRLYARLGWQRQAEVEYRGERDTLMFADLAQGQLSQ
jgi:predicted N-acetyltransferase YhbS